VLLRRKTIGKNRDSIFENKSSSSFIRAGEEQFFVPTLRVHVLRSWFRIEDIRADTKKMGQTPFLRTRAVLPS
jgi:hypothetical protein